MSPMENVLTLIAGTAPLGHSVVTVARDALAAAGARAGDAVWLAAGRACEGQAARPCFWARVQI